MNNSLDIENNECFAEFYARNITKKIPYTVGSEELIIDTNKVFLTRIIPSTLTCPLGILLNCLFLFVVCRVRSMHTLTNLYLSNQAVVDCVFLVTYFLQAVGEPLTSDIIHDKTYLGAVGCFLVNILLDICFSVSEFNITLVTFERYMAICKPFTADRVSSKSRTIKLIVMTWVVGIIFSSPRIYFYINWTKVCVFWPKTANQTDSLQTSYSTCWRDITNTMEGALYTFSTLIAFVIALTAIIVLNTLTVRELRRGARRYTSSAHDLKQRLHQQRQIVIMLAVTAGVFFICLFPYHFDQIIIFLESMPNRKDIAKPSSFTELVRWLPLVNSSVNPLIYGILNKQYRRAFFKTLFCWERRHSRAEYSMSNLTVTSATTRKESDTVETTYNLKVQNHDLAEPS
ncbi:growth hormone secretagogue receptor type 1-like [Ptychodera flava]|uniref:growth hormone secretagogue receptor type 1-like n=1 Tax=Ptychodera flava TaxID=63121 RepID=UPI00396A21D1